MLAPVALFSLVLAAASPGAAPKAPPPVAGSAPAQDGAAKGAKGGTGRGPSAPKPAPAALTAPAKAPAPRAEAFLAPSMASLGERWADSMAAHELGTEADRKAWLPAVALGVRQPLGGALALELDGAGTRFSAPVPGGRTEGWVAHAGGRAAYDRGRYGADLGVLVRAADLASPAASARVVTVLPSVEVRVRGASGNEAFLAAWNNPVLPYGEEGWLRAGARRDWGRLAGELAVGLDPVLEGEKATGPVLEGRLDVGLTKRTRAGLALRAADEPMAAVVVSSIR